jgi:hypothetical protein
MSGYRVVWRVTWLSLAVAGGATAALLPLGVVIAVFLCAGLLAVATTIVVQDDTKPDHYARRCIVNGLVGGVAMVAFAGISSVVGGAVLGLPVLAAITSPPAVAFCARQLRHERRPRRDGEQADDAGDPALRPLSNDELCAAWCASFTALREATPSQALQIVQARQRYLDELERRDPVGLHAWIASSASAGGDPRRFLDDHPPRPRNDAPG